MSCIRSPLYRTTGDLSAARNVYGKSRHVAVPLEGRKEGQKSRRLQRFNRNLGYKCYRARLKGCLRFVAADAYRFCLDLPAALTQPWAYLSAKPCTVSFLILVSSQNWGMTGISTRVVPVGTVGRDVHFFCEAHITF